MHENGSQGSLDLFALIRACRAVAGEGGSIRGFFGGAGCPQTSTRRFEVDDFVKQIFSLATQILELGERVKSLTFVPSGGGAFEIRANRKLLHSKLENSQLEISVVTI